MRDFLLEETGWKQKWENMQSGQESKMERKKMDSVGSVLQSGVQFPGTMPLFC